MNAAARMVCDVRFQRKSGRRLPQSKTLRELRQVLECGSPLPLFCTNKR